MDFGIASVAAITVIAYLVGIGCKAAGSVKDELIPVICGCVGAVLGIAGLYLMPDFPAKDIINALAVGIVSGLAATGVNQIYKQLTKTNQWEEVILISRLLLPSKERFRLFGLQNPGSLSYCHKS